jgi:hypothetical protein
LITITLTFTSVEAARAALLEIPESLLLLASSPTVKQAELPKPAPEPVAAPAPAIAKPVEVPAPVAAPVQQMPAVDYPTLQKAVFALAGKSREAAAGIAAHFGVKTFKELPQDKWADALEAVQERLAIVEAG